MTWNEIVKVFGESENEIKVSRSIGTAKGVLARMGINGESTLGQVVSHTKEIYVNRYLRLCGSSNIEKINALVKKYYPGDKLIVATDVWGGIFAISNGDFEGHPASMWYYAPDLLAWEDMGINYTKFVNWVADLQVERYYDSWLWYECEKYLAPKMSGLVGGVNSDQAVLMYPFMWSKGFDVVTATKKTVPFAEVLALNFDNEKKAQKRE